MWNSKLMWRSVPPVEQAVSLESGFERLLPGQQKSLSGLVIPTPSVSGCERRNFVVGGALFYLLPVTRLQVADGATGGIALSESSLNA
jgi:hypothetical protein